MLEAITGSTGYFSGLQIYAQQTGTSAYLSSTGYFAGGITASTGYFSGLQIYGGAQTGTSAYLSSTGDLAGGLNGINWIF